MGVCVCVCVCCVCVAESLFVQVRHGVQQRVLSMADAVYAKTWAADLSNLSVRGCIHEVCSWALGAVDVRGTSSFFESVASSECVSE